MKHREIFIPAVFTSAAVVFMLFIYSPLELLFGNDYELSYNVADILHYMLPISFAIFGLITAAFFFLQKVSPKIANALVGAEFVMFLSMLMIGTFLSKNLPPLNGSEIVWSDYSGQRWPSILVIAGFTLIVGFLAVRYRELLLKIISGVSSAALAIMILTIIIAVLTTKTESESKNVACTESYLLDMSQDEPNFIIFLLDAVSEEGYQKALAVHPEYKDYLRDFTSFENVSAAYPYTSRSLPLILSGQWYRNECNFSEYLKSALNSSSLFQSVKNAGYRMDLYSAELAIVDGMEDLFENITSASYLENPIGFVKMQLMLTGYRYFPFDLKQYCYLTPEDIYLDSRKTNGMEDNYNHNDDLAFWEKLNSHEVVYSDQSCFKFIYLWGAHEPFIQQAQSDAFEDNTYESSVEVSIAIIGDYLQKLREADVYDNSVIIILADHGYAEDLPETAEYGSAGVLGRMNPILFIKGIEEKHDYASSSAPISYADLQTAYERLLSGATSEESFDYQPGDMRERNFLMYYFGQENMIYEYCLNGTANDIGSMQPTGEVYQLE